MRKGKRTGLGDPKSHTAIIADVPTMWQKLAWDIDQFAEIQRKFPDIPEPLAFAAINVCISATSLRDWTIAAYLNRKRAEPSPPSRQDIIAHIHHYVPQQKVCEAIANTAKHSRFDEKQWTDGKVCLDLHEGDEYTPPGYVLRHIHSGRPLESIALDAFSALERDWWTELQNLGFTLPPHRHDLEWRQRSIRAIFGLPNVDAVEISPDGETGRS